MKVNLRKANEMQLAIASKANSVIGPRAIGLSEYRDVRVQLDEAEATGLANLSLAHKLNEYLFDIRRKIAKANQQSGINDLLAECAMLDRQIAILASAISVGVRVDETTLRARIQARVDRPELVSHYDIVSSSPLASVDALKEQQTALVRTKRAQKDKLLMLNIKTQIEVSDDVVEFLEIHQVI